MAAESSILKFSLKTNIVKSIFFEIISNVSRYYYTFGKSSPWPTITGIDQTNQPILISNEDNPPAVSDSYTYELETRREISYAKYIDANDAAIVVSRINWLPGRVYDQYDEYSEDYISFNGAPSMDLARFYVLTDDFNVYKCLFNNRNALSVNKPTTTTPEPFKQEDGYIWKFMYTIPLSLRNKFLTSAYMPVTTALTNQFYSNGSINSYSIEKKGKGYIKNAWKIKRFIIISTGIAYTLNGVTVTFPLPDPEDPSYGTRATAVVSELNSSGGITEIQITNQGAGYSRQPIPVITSTSGTSFEYILEYEKDLSAFTELKLIGDGYNQFNPYSLKKVNILSRGTFTAANIPSGFLFTFPATQVSYGRLPIVEVTFRLKAGSSTLYEVDEVVVEDTGYGYQQKLVFNQNVTAQPLTTFGFDCNLDETSQKNDAELIPLINSSGEIEAIQISANAPGVGYTYGVVQVIGKKTILILPADPDSSALVDLSTNPDDYGYTSGFEEASILINFTVGDIETKQSNVELLAVDGEIPIIVVEVKGNGYPADTQIVVTGDGKDCAAEAVIVNGQIDRIEVTNPGRGYTYANVTAIGGGVNSELRAIIAPRGGHGKDAVSELYAKTLMLVTRLNLEKNQEIQITNDFRQICIVKNLTNYGTNNFFTKAIGSAALKLELEVTAANTISYNEFALDDQLLIGTNRFILLEKIKNNDKYYLLVLPIDNVIPTTGSTILKISGNSSYGMSISIVTPPEFNKYSGEMLYTDNRVKFASTEEQAIAASTLITF
jgi:hypothetical protein